MTLHAIGTPLLALRIAAPVAEIASNDALSGVWQWIERFAGWGVVAWVVYYFVTKSEKTQQRMVDALHTMAESVKAEGRARIVAMREDRATQTDRHCVLLRLAEKIEEAVTRARPGNVEKS